MNRTRWILILTVLTLTVLGSWLWWAKPTIVDMASYAPANSLIYLEANRPVEVIDAVAGTQAWHTLAGFIQSKPAVPQSNWLRGFIGWTGIGPIKSVILARAQVAVVVTDLHAEEEGDTLNIKSEGALLIETHTSERRIKSTFEETIKALAEKTYGQPTSRRVVVDGVEYNEWIAPAGSRQIVGAVIGSLVVIGNSERVVQECLAVSQGRRSSLKNDAELLAIRRRVQRGNDLTFGYVPSENSAKLLAVGLPLFLGRAPGDSEFQRLITNGAANVFGSLGWSSSAHLTGIEDRYLITLRPSIIERLKPAFGTSTVSLPMQRVVPPDVYSVTFYRFANPAAAWMGLKTAVASQVDALSAIVFSSLLRSALLSYGIDNPESFLGAVNGQLLTLRLDETAERSMLIAGVGDRAALHQILTREMRVDSHGSTPTREFLEDQKGEFAASLGDDFVIMGSAADVRSYATTQVDSGRLMSANDLRRVTFFNPSPSSANVVTYTNDGERVRNFISAISAAEGGSVSTQEDVEAAIATLPYSSTETTMGERGIERTTRSPLGQFSVLLTLMFPQPSLEKTSSPSN